MVDHALADNDQGIAIEPNADIVEHIGWAGDIERNARLAVAAAIGLGVVALFLYLRPNTPTNEVDRAPYAGE